MAVAHRGRSPSTSTRRPAGSTSTTCKRKLARDDGRRLLREPRLSRRDRGRGASEIAQLAREAGAETIVGVDPISLGVLAPPGQLRRRHRGRLDAAARRSHELRRRRRAASSPRATRSATRANTRRCMSASPRRRARASTASDDAVRTRARTARARRATTGPGNSVYLWAIANAVYMSLLGPEGFRELGERDPQRSHYAARRLASIRRRARALQRRLLQGVRGRLRRHGQVRRARSTPHCSSSGIFGGLDLSASFPELGQSALYCVTEVHALEDLHRLATALAEVAREVTNETLRRYHAARWDEPLVMEMGVAGRRGLPFPARGRAMQNAVGAAAELVPPSIRRRRPPRAARTVGARRAAPLPAPVAGDARA